MKGHLSTILILCTIFLLFDCSKGNPQQNTGNSDCNSPIYNSEFQQIVGTSTYSQVKNIFGVEGDNFRNDLNGSDTIKYYKWYPCSNKNTYFVECWFMNGKLILAHKTIQDNSCSDNISSQSFLSITNGMTYVQVKSILNNIGDNFRNDYNYPSSNVKINFYRFYDCTDKSKYIEVWFYAGIGANLITKNF